MLLLWKDCDSLRAWRVLPSPGHTDFENRQRQPCEAWCLPDLAGYANDGPSAATAACRVGTRNLSRKPPRAPTCPVRGSELVFKVCAWVSGWNPEASSWPLKLSPRPWPHRYHLPAWPTAPTLQLHASLLSSSRPLWLADSQSSSSCHKHLPNARPAQAPVSCLRDPAWVLCDTHTYNWSPSLGNGVTVALMVAVPRGHPHNTRPQQCKDESDPSTDWASWPPVEPPDWHEAPEDRLLVVSSQSPEWGLGGTGEAQKVALNKGLDLEAGWWRVSFLPLHPWYGCMDIWKNDLNPKGDKDREGH